MIDIEKKNRKLLEKEKTRRRMWQEVDPENHEYIPETKPIDYYDNDINQKVAIYVRVSTDDIHQTIDMSDSFRSPDCSTLCKYT